MVYKKYSIRILDYNCGNLNSLNSIIRSLGFISFISNNKSRLLGADLMILPGVGNFSFAMQQLRNLKITQFIKDYSKNKPIIGICLGMQIFFSTSNETKKTKGLNLIKGDVKNFGKNKCKVGWDTCENIKNASINLISEKQFFYFNHTFFASTENKYVIAYSYFEKKKYPAIIRKNNFIGFQFHPEKSQYNGKKLLKNTIEELLND